MENAKAFSLSLASSPGDMYTRRFTSDELAALAQYTGPITLTGEIALARVSLRRIFNYVDEHAAGLTPGMLAEFTALTFRGVSTLAQLVRAHDAVSSDAAAGISATIAAALDELAADLDLPL